MKFKMAIAAAALTLMGSSAAQAQLDIVLDNPVQNAVSDPSTFPDLVFNGTIFNNTDNTTFTIDGDSLALPAGVTGDLPHSDLDIGSWPVTLAPGDSFRGDWLFGLDDLNTQTQSFTGTYAVTGLDDAGNPFASSVDFTVVVGGAVVPEPGTMALLVSGLVGGSLMMKRRRK